MSKHDLIDMIVTEKNLKIEYQQEDDELSKKKLMHYLRIISFEI